MRKAKPGKDIVVKKNETVAVIFHFDKKHYVRLGFGDIPKDVKDPREIYIGTAREIRRAVANRLKRLNFPHGLGIGIGAPTRDYEGRARRISKEDLAKFCDYLNAH
jgi:hypothetical protein